jgi:hypothetical protein
MTNKCVEELVDLLMYSRFTPTCFSKYLSSSGGRGVIGTPTTPEDGNHLPKRVAVNLEYINKSSSSLTHLLVIFTTILVGRCVFLFSVLFPGNTCSLTSVINMFFLIADT